MSETGTHVDIDLTVVPAQRTAVEDVLEVIHRPEPAPIVAVAAPSGQAPRRVVALVSIGMFVVGLGAGVPIGLAVAPDSSASVAPATPVSSGGIEQLLLNPLSSRPQTASGPTDQQDLIARILTP